MKYSNCNRFTPTMGYSHVARTGNTLLILESLTFPELMIEIEAITLLDYILNGTAASPSVFLTG